MKRMILPFIAAAFLASCSTEEVHAPAELIDVVIDAGIDRKTVLDGEAVKWEAGDKASLVFTSSSGAFVGEFTADIESGVIDGPAKFVGGIAADVTAENGFSDKGYLVYPSTAVDSQTGEVLFLLPSDQYAKPDGSGSFDQHLNLSSSVVSLADIREDKRADARFRNALSVLRFNLSDDVESVTISTESPLTGKPKDFVFSSEEGAEGRILMQGSVWEEPSASVTLYPEGGEGTVFRNDVTYSVLVWPGNHSWMKVVVNFKDFSSYERTLNTEISLLPSNYYSLTLAGKDLIVDHLEDRLDSVEGSLADIYGRLDELEGNQSGVEDAIAQIQSLSLMTEYLDNSVYAPYAKYTNSTEKHDIELDYIIRPTSAAKALVTAVENGDVEVTDIFKGMLYYRGADGSLSLEEAATELAVTGVKLDGDVLTVSVSASGISDGFYSGGSVAELALEISSESSETYLVSDFAKLVPMSSSGIRGNYIENIPVPKGVEVAIPFTYTVAADEYEITAVGTNTTKAAVSYNVDFKSGHLTVGISESANVSDQSVLLKITSGETVLATKEFTFMDAGVLTVTTDGPADYIGGDVVVNVERNDFNDGSLTISNANGTGVTQSNMIFTFGENLRPSTRNATAVYSIRANTLTYNKYIDISQYGTATPLKRNYYSDGSKHLLNNASAGTSYALNIVIFGDGYKKKDLNVGGKFYRTAKSAMETFFSIEPFKSFKNRFNVYMVPFESKDEGADITSSGVTKDTYFNSSFTGGGNTYATSDKDKIVSVVKNTVGLSSDADFYRTVVMLLVNTDENAGSCDYAAQTTISNSIVGDGYASFSIATLAANSTSTNGLVKHEAGGHGFGRLGDEYSQSWYTPAIINDRHEKGFYLNVATTTSYWSKFTSAGYSSSEVGYYNYMTGLYRSTDASGIMWNNNGNFNAVSRWAIYDRIRKQTEGYGDYWSAFLEYDKKNK